jgi:pimeloyl-ACP methyl ester carboxylesterase
MGPMMEPIVATAADIPAQVAAAMADPEPGQRVVVEAAGIPFSALTWGDPHARPLVLLHGVTASAAIWWRVGPALAAIGRRVVAPDLPGHGRTGHWTGRQGFADMAEDVAAGARAADVAHPDLQIVGHSYGAVVAAHLPAAGLRPSTLVLLDPPVLPHELMARQVTDTTERTYDDLDEAIAAVTIAEPRWTAGDVRAKAEALTEIDENAAREILIDNGDWDGGLSALAEPATADVDLWLIRGEQATGSYLPDSAVPTFAARMGSDHVLTIKDGAHSPQRMLPEATLVALLRALG